MRRWTLVLGALVAILLVGLASLALTDKSTRAEESVLTPREHLEQTGVIFHDLPTDQELPIQASTAIAMAREKSTAPIAPAARGTAYRVRYSDPSPTPGHHRPAWVVHFSGTKVPVRVGDLNGKASVQELSHIAVILEANGNFIKAVGIPDASWAHADAARPLEIDSAN